MPTLTINLSRESNGSGTRDSPFNSFASVNAGGWSGDDLVVELLRGSSRVLNAGTRANIVKSSGNRTLITAYGDPALPLPKLSGGGTNFNPIWVQAGSAIDIEKVHVTETPGSGLVVEQVESSAANISDVEVRDSLFTRTGLNPLLAGSDGLRLGVGSIWSAGSCTNLRAKRNVFRYNGGHGGKARGVNGALFEDNVSIGNGYASPAHGMGTSGARLLLEGPGWVNILGNIWEKSGLSIPGAPSFTGWTYVFVLGAFPIRHLYPAAIPSAPGLGEVGHGGPNTIRINVGGVNPNTLSMVQAHYISTYNATFRNNICTGTIDQNGLEGDGMYFDSGSFNCRSFNTVSFGNQGNGFQMNLATDCGHYTGYGHSNWKNGAKSGGSNRSVFYGLDLVCTGTNGVDFSANDAGQVRRCRIVNAGVGVITNDLSSNTVFEDENLYVNCAQRLLRVSNPGARSHDTTNYGEPVARPLEYLRRLAAAEALL